MIHSIHIKGFRGIKSGSMSKFKQFNILVGANNAGKSAVMEAIYLASTASQEVGLTRETDDGIKSNTVLLSKADLLGNNPFKLIAGKHGDLGDLNLSRVGEGVLIVDVPDSKAILRQFDLDITKSRFAVEDITLFALDNSQENRDLAELIWQEVDSLYDASRIVFCWYPDLTYYFKGSASWVISGQLPAAEHTFFCDISVIQSYIPIAFYRRVLNEVPGWTYRIAEHFAAIFELDPNSFTVQFVPVTGSPEKLQGRISPRDKPALSIDAFGDGARAAFKLLAPLIVMAELATPEAPGLLLWEEPESFQNPKTLGKLLAEVVKIIQDKPIQVFIATHNLEFVAYITQMLPNKHLNPDNTLLFQLNLVDGQLKSVWFNEDNLLTSLEYGLDPRVWEDFKPPFQFQFQEKQL